MSEKKIIILGAGSSTLSTGPSSLFSIGESKCALDWQIEAYAAVKADLSLIAGYEVTQLLEEFPKVEILYNSRWKETGSGFSLLQGLKDAPSEVFVNYADILFRKKTIDEVSKLDADIVIVYDSKWRTRYTQRPAHETEKAEKYYNLNGKPVVAKDIPSAEVVGEFIGLVKFSKNASLAIIKAFGKNRLTEKSRLIEVINLLVEDGLSFKSLDVLGDWAELNTPQDIARFILGTKAETLDRLQSLLTQSKIPSLKFFTNHDWKNNPSAILKEIDQFFLSKKVIVRSSANSEDSWHESLAGKFESVNNVSTEPNELSAAIEKVFNSYQSQDGLNQILVQESISDVQMSGVITTRSNSSYSPYFVISYDDQSSDTDGVTSGVCGNIKTIYCLRSKKEHVLNKELSCLTKAVEEVEKFVGHKSLDIEFVVGKNSQVYIVQVRPMVVPEGINLVLDEDIEKAVQASVEKFNEIESFNKYVHRAPTVMSVMSDWNPAEIIGITPNNLALSLYKFLITDGVWGQQRFEFGYKDVRDMPLVLSFCGHPYVDASLSLYSFIPRAISSNLTQKIHIAYVKKLIENPYLHDKIEFDIAYTFLDFTTQDRLAADKNLNLSQSEQAEFVTALKKITVEGFDKLQINLSQLDDLRKNLSDIKDQDIPPLRKIYTLLHHAKRFGTLSFSHLARLGFIGIGFLKSLRDKKVFTEDEYSQFLHSLETVSTTFQSDLMKVKQGSLSKSDLISKYGHLRPGTYDVGSPSYFSRQSEFFEKMISEATEIKPKKCAFSKATMKKIEEELINLDISMTGDEFLQFIKSSIEAREFSKFEFTRNLSLSLDLIAEYAKRIGLSENEISNLDINSIMNLSTASSYATKLHLSNMAEDGKKLHTFSQKVHFPPIISKQSDFYCYELIGAKPNYITRKSIEADVVVITAKCTDKDVAGKIVIIPNADPGFDWLFSSGVVGLVTMYGGINSHMAIRAAEFQLPSVIGAGEIIYNQLKDAKRIVIDCGQQRVVVIQ